jgi:hypothetical protein
MTTATTTRQFHIGDILTITTDHLVAPRHMDAVYDILGWMTGEPGGLFTHQLVRAAEECKPSLRAQFPDLAEVTFPAELLEGTESREAARAAVDAWLATVVARYGETRDVAPLTPEDHTRIAPMTELAAKIGPDRIVGIELPDAHPEA